MLMLTGFAPGSSGFRCPRLLSSRPRLPPSFRRGAFVDDLAHLVDLFFHLLPGAFHRLLAEVDGVGQNFAAFLDALGKRAFQEVDSLAFQERAQVLKHFLVINLLHNFWLFLSRIIRLR